MVEHTARYLMDTTVKDYESLHTVEVDHLYETLYMLITGVIGLLRNNPSVDDATAADIVAQTLHIDRSRNKGRK